MYILHKCPVCLVAVVLPYNGAHCRFCLAKLSYCRTLSRGKRHDAMCRVDVVCLYIYIYDLLVKRFAQGLPVKKPEEELLFQEPPGIS